MTRTAAGATCRLSLLPVCLSLAAILAAGLLARPSPVRAQDGAVTWDLPAFHSPYPDASAGVYVSLPRDPDGVGAAVAWRFPADVVELGVRGGLHVVDDELALLVGGDVRGTLVRAGDGFPLEVAGVVGAGLGWMPQLDVTLLRIPAGVNLGRRFPVGGGALTLYAYPRLGLDAYFSPVAGLDRPAAERPGGSRSRFWRGDDLSVHGDVDFGLDVETASGLRFRAAVTLGHREALGVGVSVP